jgi:hypothetical protein
MDLRNWPEAGIVSDYVAVQGYDITVRKQIGQNEIVVSGEFERIQRLIWAQGLPALQPPPDRRLCWNLLLPSPCSPPAPQEWSSGEDGVSESNLHRWASYYF